MARQNRRRFLANSAAAATATTVLTRRAGAAPSETINLAVVGIRGRGAHLAAGFAERDDCRIGYLCDVDRSLFASRAGQIENIQQQAPKTVEDFREALDDKTVDAVVIATPDHWHALATVWSTQAGKDVYVEKPASQTPWEGRQMVEAARRHKCIVQLGTQNRSAPYNMAAKEYLDSGKLGSVHMVRVYNQKHWGNVQAVADGDPPSTLNWDMWNGPAPLSPYNRNLHRAWNHFWRYSGGDIINDAVHQLDLARWMIGKDYPQQVFSAGGRWAQQGVLETPDTQAAIYQYDDMVMTFELTLYTPYMLKTDGELRNSDMLPYWPQNATRIEIYGSKGVMCLGRHGGGWQVFERPKSRKPVETIREYGRFPDPEHKQNFVESIRSRALPNADILQGHRSTLLCQYANISCRLDGRALAIDPATERVVGDDEANALLKRSYRDPWVVPAEV